jgi:hypothetical protein
MNLIVSTLVAAASLVMTVPVPSYDGLDSGSSRPAEAGVQAEETAGWLRFPTDL